MKKLLGIMVLGLLLSGCVATPPSSITSNKTINLNLKSRSNLVCGGNKIKIDNSYIYQYFGSGAVDKYKITKKSDDVIMGFLEGSSFDYYVYLDLREKSLQVDKIDRKTNISGVYTKYCN